MTPRIKFDNDNDDDDDYEDSGDDGDVEWAWPKNEWNHTLG